MRRLMGLGEIPVFISKRTHRCQFKRALTSVLAGHLVGVADNLLANLVKVVELLAGKVQELSPLVGVVLVHLDLGHGILGLLILLLVAVGGLARCRTVDELENLNVSKVRYWRMGLPEGDGSQYRYHGAGSRDRQCSTGSADIGFECAHLEDGRLSTGLGTDDSDLGQILQLLARFLSHCQRVRLTMLF